MKHRKSTNFVGAIAGILAGLFISHAGSASSLFANVNTIEKLKPEHRVSIETLPVGNDIKRSQPDSQLRKQSPESAYPHPEGLRNDENIIIFSEAGLTSIFQMIQHLSNRNLAVDKDVTGILSLSAEKQPPWAVLFDLILKMYQLRVVDDNGVDRIVTQDTFDRLKEKKKRKGKYRGEEIALHFIKTDIIYIFKIFEEISGLNIVLDRDVSGRVTLFLMKPLPWDQVLDLVLEMNQLEKIWHGNVIRVVTRDTYRSSSRGRVAKKYTGKKVAIHFQDMAFEDALAALSHVSQKKMVLDEKVKDRINLQIDKPIPWDYALDLIVHTHHLIMKKENDIIRITPQPQKRFRKPEKDRPQKHGKDKLKRKPTKWAGHIYFKKKSNKDRLFLFYAEATRRRHLEYDEGKCCLTTYENDLKFRDMYKGPYRLGIVRQGNEIKRQWMADQKPEVINEDILEEISTNLHRLMMNRFDPLFWYEPKRAPVLRTFNHPSKKLSSWPIEDIIGPIEQPLVREDEGEKDLMQQEWKIVDPVKSGTQ